MNLSEIFGCGLSASEAEAILIKRINLAVIAPTARVTGNIRTRENRSALGHNSENGMIFQACETYEPVAAADGLGGRIRAAMVVQIDA